MTAVDIISAGKQCGGQAANHEEYIYDKSDACALLSCNVCGLRWLPAVTGVSVRSSPTRSCPTGRSCAISSALLIPV